MMAGGDSKYIEEDTSSNGEREHVWNFLWSLNIKHILKHFFWKELHNIL